MKNTLSTIVLLAALAVGVQAQTVNVTNQVTSFAQSLYGYVTSVNTNYNWTNVTYEVATGTKQVTGASGYSWIEGQRDFTVFNQGFNLGVAGQFEGVGSKFNQVEGLFGWTLWQSYDTKIDLELGVGYTGNDVLTYVYPKTQQSLSVSYNALVIEPGVSLSKKLTQNTFLKTGITEQFFSKGKNDSSKPPVYIEAGFTF